MGVLYRQPRRHTGLCSEESAEMKSDAEFCRTEYLRCCEQYRATSPELKRHRDFYQKLSVSLLEGYIEARAGRKRG